ncbi:MAG: hypothetical protein J6A92_03285 [Lachnospiraceae bacterium]|nr:hypothetical protein [Lachnospiraceae bacterium]
MTAKEFVANFKPKYSEYCPCIITWDGEVYACEGSHLDEMVRLCGDENILNEIPQNVSPMFYLTGKLRCVVVDYENQLYSEDFSQEQRYALLDLAEAKLILLNPMDVSGKQAL